jgi:hypothetical protein
MLSYLFYAKNASCSQTVAIMVKLVQMQGQSSTHIDFKRVVPTLVELIGLLLLTIFIVVLGNTKSLIEYYGLAGSDEVISHSTSQAVASGLGKLDQFSFTDKVVTFIVWAIIGVLCFSIVQVIARFYHDFEAQEEVSSNRYIHPATFVRAVFWRRVVLDFIGLLLCLVALGAALYCMLAFVLPIALTNTRAFLTGISLINFGGFVSGFFMLYGWVFVLAIIMKLLVNRHRLINR